jgi:CRISPR-associated Csx2 family protein
MARKVFISILGTGFYGSCQYASDDFTSNTTCFVQEATLEYIGAKNWTAQDTALIFLTQQARKDNWDKSITKRKRGTTEEPYTGLEQLLENMKLPFSPEGVDIVDGRDENEIWGIFNTIYDKLEENDILYFDLTHSFRYLPMLLLVLGNYSKFLKNTSIAHISYGNYEARNQDTNIAPFVDLLPIAALQDWTSASVSFINNGDVSQIVGLCEYTLRPILRNNIDENTEKARNLNKYSKALETVVSDMYGCRGLKLLQSSDITNLFETESHLDKILIEPMKPIIKKLRDSFSGFKHEQNIMNGYFAAQWCFDHNLFQQALTVLHENMVSHICELHNIELNNDSKRGLVNKAFNIYLNERPKEEWDIQTEEDEKIIETIICEENSLFQRFAPIFNSTTTLRNDYNHAGMRNNPTSLDKIKKKLQECIRNLFEIINEINDTNTSKNSDSKFIFINLSNHPSTNWQPEQLAVAQSFGEVVDIPFPAVDPTGDESYIQTLCDEYVEKVLQATKGEKAIVHVMGEMALTFSLVHALQTKGCICMASTSQRISTDKGDGTKEIKFVFNRFRKYELVTN